jgi:hypothetical protein
MSGGLSIAHLVLRADDRRFFAVETDQLTVDRARRFAFESPSRADIRTANDCFNRGGGVKTALAFQRQGRG